MGTIKMLFGVFVIAAAVYVGAKVAPVYMDNYQFEDAVKNEATLDTYSNKTEDDIRTAIFKKAQDLEIPITEDQIEVRREGMQGRGTITIHAPYQVHIDLPGYPVDIHFDAGTENRGVL
jgi:hypothetical protein